MDNRVQQCPPMMSDGRLFTDWRSSSTREQYNKYINDIPSEYDYRAFLINNAQTIMDNEWTHIRKTRSCWDNSCIHTYPSRMYPPWMDEQRQKFNSVMKGVQYECEQLNDNRLYK